MISRGSDTLIYDADNRLHSYDADTGNDTSFVYDADGNRVLRIHGGTTTTTIGDLFESDGTTTRTYYTFGSLTVGYREHTTSTDDRFYLTGDHLGSTATVIDATDIGNPVDQYY
jgi:YD repeat-containing protein